MKRRMRELTEQERIKTLDSLYTAAASVQGRDAMKLFLRDLLTESERVMLGRRVMVARLLLRGETRDSIRKKTGVGYGTIERVRHWLKDQVPGYEQAIRAMEEEFGRRDFKKRYAKSMLVRLKNDTHCTFSYSRAPKTKTLPYMVVF